MKMVEPLFCNDYLSAAFVLAEVTIYPPQTSLSVCDHEPAKSNKNMATNQTVCVFGSVKCSV